MQPPRTYITIPLSHIHIHIHILILIPIIVNANENLHIPSACCRCIASSKYQFKLVVLLHN